MKALYRTGKRVVAAHSITRPYVGRAMHVELQGQTLGTIVKTYEGSDLLPPAYDVLWDHHNEPMHMEDREISLAGAGGMLRDRLDGSKPIDANNYF